MFSLESQCQIFVDGGDQGVAEGADAVAGAIDITEADPAAAPTCTPTHSDTDPPDDAASSGETRRPAVHFSIIFFFCFYTFRETSEFLQAFDMLMRIHFHAWLKISTRVQCFNIFSCKHTVHTGAYRTLCFSLRVISFKMLSMFIRSGAGHGFHRTFRFLYALTPHCRISQGVRLTSCHRFHKSCFDLLHKPRHLTVDRNPSWWGCHSCIQCRWMILECAHRASAVPGQWTAQVKCRCVWCTEIGNWPCNVFHTVYDRHKNRHLQVHFTSADSLVTSEKNSKV